MRRTRTRAQLLRIAQWAGTCISLLVLAAWAFSSPLLGDHGPELTRASRTIDWTYSLDAGTLVIDRWVHENERWEGWSFFDYDGRKGNEILDAFGLRMPSFQRHDSPTYQVVIIPLWLIFALAVIPTCILWYRERRRFPAGHCRSCGYDLTGNVSGVCPECGTRCGTIGG